MGRIEDQIVSRTNEFISDLKWYAKAMNLLQANYVRSVNELNRAFNEKMAKYKEPEKPKRTRKKKSVNEDDKPKEE